MNRRDLPDGHHFLTGELPAGLRFNEEEFETLWDHHPEEFHEVRTPKGTWVPTPRWQQAYERDYVYTGSRNNAIPIGELTSDVPRLERVIGWCREEIDVRLNGFLLNWYDGSLGHYIGKHRDSRKGLVEGAPIVTLSLGAARTFRLRAYERDAKRFDFDAADGTVLVLPYETNLAWTHEITKSKRCRGRRISVTLRAFS